MLWAMLSESVALRRDRGAEGCATEPVNEQATRRGEPEAAEEAALESHLLPLRDLRYLDQRHCHEQHQQPATEVAQQEGSR